MRTTVAVATPTPDRAAIDHGKRIFDPIDAIAAWVARTAGGVKP
jgi:hypothetical protein